MYFPFDIKRVPSLKRKDRLSTLLEGELNTLQNTNVIFNLYTEKKITLQGSIFSLFSKGVADHSKLPILIIRKQFFSFKLS